MTNDKHDNHGDNGRRDVNHVSLLLLVFLVQESGSFVVDHQRKYQYGIGYCQKYERNKNSSRNIQPIHDCLIKWAPTEFGRLHNSMTAGPKALCDCFILKPFDKMK